jgi:antitoxin MazE
MKTQIIQIGNSQGIRISKVLLEESHISGEVDVELHPEGILIRNAHGPRAGWDEAFKTAEDDNASTSEGPANAFDKKEWQW